MAVSVLWSDREFGGAEIYVRSVERHFGVRVVALKALPARQLLRLVISILLGRELHIFHDVRAALLIALAPWRRHVVVIHGPGRWARATRVAVRVASLCAKAVVLVSDNILAAPLPARVTVVRNWSSAGIVATGSATDAVYFGRVETEKGVSRLTSFWDAYMRPNKLHIVGDGSLLASLRDRYPDDPEIKFYGALPHARIRDIASKCRYYISFSEREGLSLSLLEAMDGGLIPIIAANPSQRFIHEAMQLPVVGDDLPLLAGEIQALNSVRTEELEKLRERVRVLTNDPSGWLGFWENTLASEKS